jgi:hypothetical protein
MQPQPQSLVKTLVAAALILVAVLPKPGRTVEGSVRGYLKQVQAIGVRQQNDPVSLTALWTQRLEAEVFAGQSLRLFWGQKTRLAHGDILRAVPDYARQLDTTNDQVAVALTLSDGPDHVLHTVPDRLGLDWTLNNWQVVLGRQRVHWGQNLGWNPLDWFNAANPLDFDDEEHGGIDAALAQWYFSPTGTLEAILRPGAAALMGRAAVFSYDLQLQAGRLRDGATALGLGWSGALGPAAFRGEYTVFLSAGATQHLAGVTGDYSFASQLFVGGGVLFNSAGANKPDAMSLLPGGLSVRDLNPARLNVQLNAGYPLTPLWNADLYLFANPLDASAWLVPGLGWSVGQNVDALLNLQLGLGNRGTQYHAKEKVVNLRWKWSF